jgi:catechol 2,3-dioxygenase-like lactoylglutathione lyase family enzyme
METVIAGLLKDFEDGKMSRRQLIQSLALAAAAAMPGAAALAQTPASAPKPPIPQAFEPAPWKTVWLDHISYAVTDYRKSTAFYRDLMGWTVRNDNGTNQATLDINGIGGIIIRNRRAPAEGQPPSPPASASQGTAGAATTTPAAATANAQPAGQRTRPPITGVINHVSWGVQPWDTEKVKGELEKRGLAPRPDMVGENFKSFHVTDPDGWDLQISNQTKDSKD